MGTNDEHDRLGTKMKDVELNEDDEDGRGWPKLRRSEQEWGT